MTPLLQLPERLPEVQSTNLSMLLLARDMACGIHQRPIVCDQCLAGEFLAIKLWSWVQSKAAKKKKKKRKIAKGLFYIYFSLKCNIFKLLLGVASLMPAFMSDESSKLTTDVTGESTRFLLAKSHKIDWLFSQQTKLFFLTSIRHKCAPSSVYPYLIARSHLSLMSLLKVYSKFLQ